MKDSHRGFLVHSYVDLRRNRLYLLGRFEDGRSFAAVETRWRPSLHIFEKDLHRCKSLLSAFNFKIIQATFESFDGKEKLVLLEFSCYADRSSAVKLLEAGAVPSPDSDLKPADAYLMERQIKGPVEIAGDSRPGHFVDLVFRDSVLCSPKEKGKKRIPLKLLSIDIETDVKKGTILAVGISSFGSNDTASLVRVLAAGESGCEGIIFHPDEKSLLAAFVLDVRKADPDVLTGWNFLDFDYPRLAERCELNHVPFALGRGQELAKFFPGSQSNSEKSSKDTTEESPWYDRRRSAAALVPGRQVIDALRVMRSGPRRLSGYTLETAAQEVLGEGKLVAAAGDQKIEELEKLYREDPLRFGAYCRRDAELVPLILDKAGLFNLTVERASHTGVTLDKAWTSVVSFERIYGMELWGRGIAQPPKTLGREVSGAAGGTILEPLQGVFPNVAIFDFRSLYPTIMLTFNIDPFAHARAEETGTICAPNGALFSRSPGILPELIAAYFAERRKALDAGDEEASQVYKILMNSFYGVLGTASCRYGRTELAGAITSFARKWLYLSRDWFNAKGYRVLYGDTDSLFVETGLGDKAGNGDFLEFGKALTGELNAHLAEKIHEEYGLISHLELRFEKAYRRFMIPPLRNLQYASGISESKGRAKGYGGWVIGKDGSLTVEVKGMEAVRSDSTPLARRIQMELLELVFSSGTEEDLKKYVFEILRKLRRGELDDKLIYRKRLARTPETYTSSTPPQVKAARILGWKNRKGTVEYIWTVRGPEPVSMPHAVPDYDHYMDSQVLPVARSIAAAAGWNTEISPYSKRDRLSDGQMELGL
ncbi:DNA polymerase domain-containing protein [Leadbettera azotonutricia]|uniref:DNA polymerase n=1 Tax=Leadbettera azotonutricia (strain ATCC BAA-888 / DSM 13862 / ZAS-9) TaxID=545695 RepID=F5YF74_LEAAZ|nr:DNA polymerase domain-containing protein [Leadbettera azotonutricia]AEF81036.1 DNA polymerase II [Leadbettera azotonutricia ZAS-9]